MLVLGLRPGIYFTPDSTVGSHLIRTHLIVEQVFRARCVYGYGCNGIYNTRRFVDVCGACQ